MLDGRSNSNFYNTRTYSVKVEAMRSCVPSAFQNICEEAVSAPMGELRECAFIRGLNGVVEERHHLVSNFLREEDRFIQDLRRRGRDLTERGISCAVHLDFLAIESDWQRTPRKTWFDLERFRRSVRLPGYAKKGNPEDLRIVARRRYLVDRDLYLEGPGVSVARADYCKMTLDHYATLNSVREAWEEGDGDDGPISLGLLDRIDVPEYSVWRRYEDGSVLSTVVTGRFWADIDLHVQGTMTFDPRTFCEFEQDRLNRLSRRTDHAAILAAAKDPRALKRSMDTFNLWLEGVVEDQPMWYF